MAGVKIVVLYPVPRDVGAFEQAYVQEHAPMVTPRNFQGMTKFVASKIVATPDGSAPPFQRIAELYFPSLGALQTAAGAASAQQVVAHAVSISSGGPPVILIAEVETTEF
jgi:uncharacterized protein (TIGR02118 family)